MLSLHYLADDWMNHPFITIYHGQTSTNQVINSQDAERAKEDMLHIVTAVQLPMYLEYYKIYLHLIYLLLHLGGNK